MLVIILFIKSLPKDLSSYGYMAITTGLAGIVMMFMCIKQLHKIQFAMVGKSLCLALLLCGNLLTEKFGLMYMSSSMASFLLWYLEEPTVIFGLSYEPQIISSLLILTLFSKIYAYIMLMYAQKYANPMDVTVIASTEPVVTLILAVLLPTAYGAGEALTFGAFSGSMLIALGAVVAGITFDGMLNNRKEAESDTKVKYITTFISVKQWLKTEITGTRIKQGIGIFLAFAFLGAAFKVMVLVEGFTEVRPVNAIPMAAGLITGPIGGIACEIGNLVADFAGDLGTTSILGVAANFIGAFLPYRLWYLCTKEEPRLNTFGNLGIYCLISFISALAAAFIIGAGLDIFFHIQNPFIYQSVFVNNLAFSILLGMPLFILLISKEFKVTCVKPINYYFLQGKREKSAAMGIFTFAMVAVLLYMGNGSSISDSPLMILLTEGQ